MFVADSNLHCRSDYRKDEYEDMNDRQTIARIEEAMNGIQIVERGPVKNTTRKDCYRALNKIRCALFDNWMWHKCQNAEAFIEDYKKMYGENSLSEDINHVSYEPEQMGYDK